MTITTISLACLNAVKGFEGFVDHQYRDGVGVLTIGYGTTSADVSPLPKHLTEPEAARLLEAKLNRKYLPSVMHALGPMNPTRNMVEACVSFAYNLGEGAFEGAHGFETLTRALRANDKHAVAEAILLYDNPNDPVDHQGLKRRREFERAWFLRADETPADALAGYPAEEVAAIREYDRLLRASADSTRRQQLRAWMTDRRKTIWRLSQPKTPTGGGDGLGWDHNLRLQRFNSLKARTS
jgi:lysozyme